MKCNKWYIGETKQDLGARMSGHRACVNKVKRGGVLNDDMNDNGTAYNFGGVPHFLTYSYFWGVPEFCSCGGDI